MTRYRFAYLYVYLFRYCWELSFLCDSKTLLCGADDCNYMWEKGGEGDNNKKERMKRLEWNVRTQLRDPGSLAVYCFSHPFFFYSFRYAYPFLIFPFCFLLALYFKGTPLLYLNNVYTLCTLWLVGTFFFSGPLTPQHEDLVVVAITVIIKTAPTNFVSLYFNHRGESVWTVFLVRFPTCCKSQAAENWTRKRKVKNKEGRKEHQSKYIWIVLRYLIAISPKLNKNRRWWAHLIMYSVV